MERIYKEEDLELSNLKTNTSPQAEKKEFSQNLSQKSKNPPHEKQLASALAAAAQVAMLRHGFTPDRYKEAEIAKAFGRWCEQTGHTPAEAVEFEEKSFRRWLEEASLMFHDWGWRWWFKRGYWATPDRWPYDKQKLKELGDRREASIGSGSNVRIDPEQYRREEKARITAHLARAAAAMEAAGVEAPVVQRLAEISRSVGDNPDFEQLDRELTELEERLFAWAETSAPEDELAGLREEGAAALSARRGRMTAAVIEKVERQFVQKRLLEARRLPRLSVLYMPPLDPGSTEAGSGIASESLLAAEREFPAPAERGSDGETPGKGESHGPNGEIPAADREAWEYVRRLAKEHLARLAKANPGIKLEWQKQALEPAQLESVGTKNGKRVWKLLSPAPATLRIVLELLSEPVFRMAAGGVEIEVISDPAP